MVDKSVYFVNSIGFSPVTRSDKREQLIDVALRLFSRHGYHATGIDLILKEAGIAKKTLYHHFPSKEDLIVEVLRKYDKQFIAAVDEKVRRLADSPSERLLAIFEVAHEWFKDKHFYGCMFINAIGEYSESDTSIRQVCKEFKASMRKYIYELCTASGFREPEKLSEELALLLEGSIVTAQVSGNPDAAYIARRTAEVLLKERAARSGEK